MKLFDFLKEEWVPILIAMLVIGVAICVIVFLVAVDEPQASDMLMAPLTENNEPTTEEVTTTKKVATKPKATTEATTTEVSTTEEVTETEPVHYTYEYYDVPLDTDLQNHIFEVCDYYGVDPDLVMAMIQKESNFVIDSMGDGGNSYGLMQIQPMWHHERMSQLGCYDLLDPYQNVRVGVDILEELFAKSDSVTWVLMAYNGGESFADEMAAAGQLSEYARLVLKYKSELRYSYYAN